MVIALNVKHIWFVRDRSSDLGLVARLKHGILGLRLCSQCS